MLQDFTQEQREAIKAHNVSVCFGVAEGGSAFREDVFYDVARRNLAHMEGTGKPAVQFAKSIGAIPSMPTSHVARAHGFHGQTITVAGACAATIQAYWAASMLIKSGEADFVVAGAAEDLITGTILPTFSLMGVMTSIKEGRSLEETPSAFDEGSSGFVLGSGGVSMMLTRVSKAKELSLPITAILRGIGQTNDAFHAAVPEPSGFELARAMRIAIAQSGLSPDDIDVVVAHGAGTNIGDAAEATALMAVFGTCPIFPYVTGIKPIIGHMMGPASGSSGWAAMKMIQTGIIPPIANLVNPINSIIPFVIGSYVTSYVKNVLVVGIGLGSNNAAVVVSAP